MTSALKKGENEAENLSQMNGRKVRVDNLTSNCSLQVQWTLIKMNTKESASTVSTKGVTFGISTAETNMYQHHLFSFQSRCSRGLPAGYGSHVRILKLKNPTLYGYIHKIGIFKP